MKSFSLGLVGLGIIGMVAGIAGCPSSFVGCEEGPCGTDGGGVDGAGDTSVADGNTPDSEPPPKDCLTPTEPAKNPEKCLVDSFGVFVSPTGDDANDGSKTRPFKTIGKALGTTRSRIVVCEGDYPGSLDIGRGVEIFGGVACDFAKAGAKAKVAASKAAYGIKVGKVAAAVILADLEVVGMNGASPGESSVGLFVTESANVKLLRAKIEAGDGADAAPKRDGAFTFPADALLRGAPGDDKGTGTFADDTGGAGGSTGACPGGGTSSGGRGGDNGAQGVDASPRPPGGAKGGVGDCSAMGVGFAGTLGMPGTDRAGATVIASVSPSGFTGSSGLDGSSGLAGGGGGGGYGFSGAGGGGGAGGCGGQGGLGGGAGGSSVAVLVFASEVLVEASELVGKTAKAGGQGGSGQAGQLGGARGGGSNMACQGGNGSQGGTGGHGGGGAGGISAGIAWSTGKEPTRDAITKITRATTPAPLGGEGGGGTATKGVDGVHADVFEVK